MFKDIYLFELKYRFSRPATYIYFVLLFIIPFLVFGLGNTPASEKVYHNSPAVIANFMVLISILGILIASAVMGVPLYRDLEHKTGNFLFSYPISKTSYFMGRFWGSFTTLAFISLGALVGVFLGSLLGPVLGTDPDRYGTDQLLNYLQPWAFFLLSNLWLGGTLFFALIVFTRNIRSIYTGGILVFVLYLIANSLSNDIENKDLVQLLDPYGMMTLTIHNKYLTPFEQNNLLVSLTGNLLLNRILWFGVGLVFFLTSYFRFNIPYFFQTQPKKKPLEQESIQASTQNPPAVRTDFSGSHHWKSLFSLSLLEIRNILKDGYFLAILLGGIVFLAMNFWKGSSSYSVSDLPTSLLLMESKHNSFTPFVMIILVFFTGEALHRERSSGFSVVYDSYPIKDISMMLSKFLAMCLVAFILATLPILLGIVVQILKGYPHFNFPIYLIDSYLISFPDYLQIALLVFAVHLIVNRKFAGHVTAIALLLAINEFRNQSDYNLNLLYYSYKPDFKWSEMNGIGHFLEPLSWFNLYWTSFGLFLMFFTGIFFSRGTNHTFKSRLKSAKSKLNTTPTRLSFAFLVVFIVSGAFIFKSIVYDHNYLSRSEEKSRKAAYELQLKKYDRLPQPKITRVSIHADLFPAEREALFKATIQLVNKTDSKIDSIHFHSSYLSSFRVIHQEKVLPYRFPLVYNSPKLQLWTKKEEKPWYQIVALPETLHPGDTLELLIESEMKFHGFPNSGLGRELVYNGSFISGVIPSIGYSSSLELESEEDRKSFGLSPKTEDLPHAHDPYGRSTLLYGDDADLIYFEAIVSTDPSQLAIAPGYVQREWVENGRRYFHYKQDTPIQSFFSFLSARYQVLEDKVRLPEGREVKIEIFHHPDHQYNLDRFLSAYKNGITYFSQTYGDFQFEQMRLLEYPRYSGFAQSFPNTVPFPESFGWLADFKNPDDFDYVYFVTAHELAHQWWGHQVTPNFTQGSNVISESLAEYSALVLTERKYGKDNMSRFLKEELDNYLTGRAYESKKENAFINSDRPYQLYNKGSLVLYGLRDLIGQDAMDSALFAFNKEFRLKESPPYAGSHDLYRHLDAVTPDSLKYYLEDSWTKITLYENKMEKVTAKKLDDGSYEVSLEFTSQKRYADEQGEEKVAQYEGDYMDIGIFAQEDRDENGRKRTNPIYLQKHKIKPGKTQLTIRVEGEPKMAGIDPFNKLIDRIPDDNILSVETSESKK